MAVRLLIGFYILLFVIFCIPVIGYSEEQWRGLYAGNKIPLREVISSVYIAKIYTAVQSSLATHFRDANQDFISGCKSDGGHAFINTTMSLSVGEVLIGSVSYKNGVIFTLAGDCVTDSRLAAK